MEDVDLLSSSGVDMAAKCMSDDGFAVLSKAIPMHLLEEWQKFSTEYFDQVFQALHRTGRISSPSALNEVGEPTLGLSVKNGFREIVMRSPRRFELSLLNLNVDRFREQLLINHTNSAQDEKSFRIPATQPIISILEPLILGVFKKASSLEDLKLCHTSLLVSTPGSCDQAWHSDGGHVSLSEHLPCHCINIFIPLQDAPHTMGPTEFRPGGHFLSRNLAPMMLAAKCRRTLRAPVWPALKMRDAVIFDYRVLHRGRANTTKDNRHFLVLTFCESWFEDILNFPRRSMLDVAYE